MKIMALQIQRATLPTLPFFQRKRPSDIYHCLCNQVVFKQFKVFFWIEMVLWKKTFHSTTASTCRKSKNKTLDTNFRLNKCSTRFMLRKLRLRWQWTPTIKSKNLSEYVGRSLQIKATRACKHSVSTQGSRGQRIAQREERAQHNNQCVRTELNSMPSIKKQ